MVEVAAVGDERGAIHDLTPRRWFTIIGGWIVARSGRREHPEVSRWTSSLGIVEIIVILAVALIVIPPENLPDVMRATGKVLRELRLASNMVMREIGGALDQPDDRPTPINTMKPSGTGGNIAQTASSADSGAAAEVKTSGEIAASAGTATPSATASAEPEAAPDGPKAIV
jgi:Sec-independent protein translocase protein TatA